VSSVVTTESHPHSSNKGFQSFLLGRYLIKQLATNSFQQHRPFVRRGWDYALIL
jgi:hypothetical protein